jgi:hypothetical protein
MQYKTKYETKYVEKENYYIGITRNGTTFLFDKDDFEQISVRKWHNSRKYIVTTEKRVGPKWGYAQMLLSRYLMKLDSSDPKIVDHINGDTFDNRRQNLRVCTKKENIHNSITAHMKNGGVKGVYFCRQREVWYATIRADGNRIFLGTHKTKSDAITARKIAEEQYRGEYSVYKSRGIPIE